MTYTLTEDEWNRLIKLSTEARNMPVMALSVADGITGNDFASIARRRVDAFWRELGSKYGFDPSDVKPVDESKRQISAQAVSNG